MGQTDDASTTEQSAAASAERAAENAANDVKEDVKEKYVAHSIKHDNTTTAQPKLDLSEITTAIAAIPEQVANAVREAWQPPEATKQETAKSDEAERFTADEWTKRSGSSDKQAPAEKKSFADKWFS